MNSQTQKQQKRNGIISITLILAILVASAFALLVAKDSKTNVFEIGKVNIQLWEKFDTDLDGVAEVYDDTVETPPVVTKLLPSKSIEKNPYVKNVGNTDAWVFLTVGIPTATDEAIAQSKFGTDNRVQVRVQAYAIQKDYKDKTTAAAVWSDYFDNATQYKEERTSDETELFTLNGIENNQNWTCIDTEPYRANGYNYYTYAYKSLLAPNASTEADYLFNSVTLLDSIGTGASSSGSGSSTNPSLIISETATLPTDITNIDLNKYIVVTCTQNNEREQWAYYTKLPEQLVLDMFQPEEQEQTYEIQNVFPYSTLEDAVWESNNASQEVYITYPDANIFVRLACEDGRFLIALQYFDDSAPVLDGDVVFGLQITEIALDTIDDDEDRTYTFSNFNEGTEVKICLGYSADTMGNWDFSNCHNLPANSIKIGYQNENPSNDTIAKMQLLADQYEFIEYVGYCE